MLYLDSAAADECETWVGSGTVRGVTTNATILARAGAGSVSAAVKGILDWGPDEVHAQVLSESDDEAFDQATGLAGLDPRVRVKIPLVTSAGRHRAGLIRRAGQAGIPVNITVCTSQAELYLGLSLEPDYLSMLWCRTRDAGEDPARVLRALAARRDAAGIRTRLLIGSIRTPEDVTDALEAPSDVVTVPPAVLGPWLAGSRSAEMARQFAADAAGLVA